LEEFENTAEMAINDLLYSALKLFERVIKTVKHLTRSCNNVNEKLYFFYSGSFKLDCGCYTENAILLHMYARIVAHVSNIYRQFRRKEEN